MDINALRTDIAYQIKPISIIDVNNDYAKLCVTANAIRAGGLPPPARCRTGNMVVDHFTFAARLATKGKYGASFYDFVANIEHFKQKKFIQNMLHYCNTVKNRNNTKNEYVVLKEVYNICISAINIMRPLNCIELFVQFNSRRVLNPCAGWGGSLVAAAALNLEAHIGIDINTDLVVPYTNLTNYLMKGHNTRYNTCHTNHHTNPCIMIENHIGVDAVLFDYSSIRYDTVFMSPPYYAIEKYANNKTYESKQEMDDEFYYPLFQTTYQHLLPSGYYIINVCKEVYERVLIRCLGPAQIIQPFKKSVRTNKSNYTEMVYIWQKV